VGLPSEILWNRNIDFYKLKSKNPLDKNNSKFNNFCSLSKKFTKTKCEPLIIEDFPKVEGRGSQLERVRVSSHPTKQNKLCYTQWPCH
jgi:hypothetical protein